MPSIFYEKSFQKLFASSRRRMCGGWGVRESIKWTTKNWKPGSTCCILHNQFSFVLSNLGLICSSKWAIGRQSAFTLRGKIENWTRDIGIIKRFVFRQGKRGKRFWMMRRWIFWFGYGENRSLLQREWRFMKWKAYWHGSMFVWQYQIEVHIVLVFF